MQPPHTLNIAQDNIEIEINETNRGNEQIIINKKHKSNFSFQRKDKSKIYRCTEYKTLNKCKSLIILNDKKEVLKYESLHNHLEKEIDVSISVAKHKIKEEIKKNSIPMDIKPKHIFNAISQEMGLICPEYSTIRSQIIRNINKQFPPNIKTPKFSYQLFITRTYVGEFNMSNTLITTINFHCDFEQGISNAAKKVFPNINIKYCVWHYKRSLEKQKNILCYHEVKNNNDYNNFLQFLEYFNKNYLLKYNVNNWNYYENIEHLTNNASESYNSYLNNIFPNKPLFYKLIYILKEEENLSYNDYQRRTKGNWKKKQKIFSATDEIKILIENYKSKEINLFYNGCNRNELFKLWKECLIDLNDININLK
ncbi:hypothetical protein H8356DRAFT_1331931 [Neocallimastix lanati (nom. inval.)]|nr:hypothetical protein H8356DRAFT_1331931 [Neocallimastix sp. JGI-2020a]